MGFVKSVAVLAFILMASNSHSVQRDAYGVTIKNIYTYTKYGNGDVQIIASSPAPNCEGGFWLSPNDAGYDAALSSLISAYHTQSLVVLSGEDEDIWPGSGTRHCRLEAVGLL